MPIPRKFLATLLTLTAAAAAEPAKDAVVNDAWYTMETGGLPWGSYHEVIEKKKDGRYSYRSIMTKHEGENTYQINVGAVAEDDLTPVAFNIVTSGVGATEIANGTFTKGTSGGTFKIQIQGAKNTTLSRALSAGTIDEAFFPIWLSKRWNDLNAKGKGTVQVFAEAPERQDFMQSAVFFKFKGEDVKSGCTQLTVERAGKTQEWCLTKQGRLVTLAFGPIRVKRVANEAEAKAFLDRKSKR